MTVAEVRSWGVRGAAAAAAELESECGLACETWNEIMPSRAAWAQQLFYVVSSMRQLKM